MRAEGVLPGEDEMYQTLLAAHIDELGADSPLERMFIERAVKASLKLLRGDRVEGALAARLMTAAAAGSADRDAAEVERLKTEIAADPAGTVRQLRKSVAGCLWIREKWLVLQKRMQKNISMLPSQRELSIHLLDKHMRDIYNYDSEVARWVVAHLGTLFGDEKDVDAKRIIDNTGIPKARMSPKELDVRVAAVIESIPDRRRARRLMLGYIAEELAKLNDHIAFVTDVAEHNRACDVQAAEIALNADGKQLLGYVTTQRQSYDAALRRLDALRNPRRPGPGRGPGSGSGKAKGQTRTEPPAATVATKAADVVETPAIVTTDAEAAVVPEAARSDCEPRVEATTESPPLTELEAADEPEDESLTDESLGSDDRLMEPVDESFFTTEPNLSDEPPIELEGEFPATDLSGPDAMTIQQAAQYRATRLAAVELPPIDPKVAAATERIGERVRESVLASLKEKADKINAEFDAKERRERAEFAASIQAQYGSRMPTAVPNNGSNTDATRAPPGGGAPAG